MPSKKKAPVGKVSPNTDAAAAPSRKTTPAGKAPPVKRAGPASNASSRPAAKQKSEPVQVASLVNGKQVGITEIRNLISVNVELIFNVKVVTSEGSTIEPSCSDVITFVVARPQGEVVDISCFYDSIVAHVIESLDHENPELIQGKVLSADMGDMGQENLLLLNYKK